MNILNQIVTGAIVTGLATTAFAGTLDDVKKRDKLICGVNTGLPGFSSTDSKGNWSGIDVDYCRGIAAAVLGDASKVEFKPLTAQQRFTALQSGEIDVLARNTTWTFSRDASLGGNFVGTNYYDGQGFMVKKSLGIKSAKELDGASVCVLSGTTSELNVTDYFRANKMKFKPVVFDNADQVSQGFDSARCDVMTSDQSQLYSLRVKLKDPSSAVVLPEVISKEPLGPMVRQGDDDWYNIARWTLIAMINAEELGVTKANADQMKTSDNPQIKRLLGQEGVKGEWLKLNDDWSYQIIKQVGNYGESFKNNIGEGTPLNISRGLNALWKDGGLMYGAPIR